MEKNVSHLKIQNGRHFPPFCKMAAIELLFSSLNWIEWSDLNDFSVDLYVCDYAEADFNTLELPNRFYLPVIAQTYMQLTPNNGYSMCIVV